MVGMSVRGIEIGIFVGDFEEGEEEGMAEGEVVGELVILDMVGKAVDGEKLGAAVIGFVEVGIVVEGEAVEMIVLGKRVREVGDRD